MQLRRGDAAVERTSCINELQHQRAALVDLFTTVSHWTRGRGCH